MKYFIFLICGILASCHPLTQSSLENRDKILGCYYFDNEYEKGILKIDSVFSYLGGSKSRYEFFYTNSGWTFEPEFSVGVSNSIVIFENEPSRYIWFFEDHNFRILSVYTENDGHLEFHRAKC
jgi:hypothetical protein